jgi:hypothetical protein
LFAPFDIWTRRSSITAHSLTDNSLGQLTCAPADMKGNFVQTMSNALKGWPLQTRVCAEGMIDIIKKSRVSQRVSVNLGLTKKLGADQCALLDTLRDVLIK